jgi:hypothetical protein
MATQIQNVCTKFRRRNCSYNIDEKAKVRGGSIPSPARSRATREANPRRHRSQPPRHNPRASKEGGGGAPPSPLSRRVRVGIRGSFFALGSGQRPATAVGWHSCRSSRAPSSAAVWCVVGGPHDVLTSGGVGGAWTLDPAGERLQEARVEETTRRLCPVAFWRQWNYWSMMVDAPGGLRRRRMELGGQIQRWRWCARAYRRWCNG